MVNAVPTISPAQLRAARAWLNWSQAELAKAASVAKTVVNRYEQGHSVPHADSIKKVQGILEAAGIRFAFDGMKGTGISAVD
ncbi:helix-turn-helix domain-containing protein [Bradyrhizobium japonicum]|uniref:helix-turn-helix domain-containing protein n=1 Tax=Bradyrhizobium japonicum TaxID=375 RepID=UPI001BACBFF0|nr:helix-turn-helix transcriptional regulator [Bradyrhizobium japonicum]MBR0910631.1 helix-turn-helix transcriptional regulator [Bradyrhizobium japonicum]